MFFIIFLIGISSAIIFDNRYEIISKKYFSQQTFSYDLNKACVISNNTQIYLQNAFTMEQSFPLTINHNGTLVNCFNLNGFSYLAFLENINSENFITIYFLRGFNQYEKKYIFELYSSECKIVLRFDPVFSNLFAITTCPNNVNGSTVEIYKIIEPLEGDLEVLPVQLLGTIIVNNKTIYDFLLIEDIFYFIEDNEIKRLPLWSLMSQADMIGKINGRLFPFILFKLPPKPVRSSRHLQHSQMEQPNSHFWTIIHIIEIILVFVIIFFLRFYQNIMGKPSPFLSNLINRDREVKISSSI